MKYCEAEAKENKRDPALREPKTGVLWSDVLDKTRDFGSPRIFLKWSAPTAARP
jgi:hypothetical protein